MAIDDTIKGIHANLPQKKKRRIKRGRKDTPSFRVFAVVTALLFVLLCESNENAGKCDMILDADTIYNGCTMSSPKKKHPVLILYAKKKRIQSRHADNITS